MPPTASFTTFAYAITATCSPSVTGAAHSASGTYVPSLVCEPQSGLAHKMRRLPVLQGMCRLLHVRTHTSGHLSAAAAKHAPAAMHTAQRASCAAITIDARSIASTTACMSAPVGATLHTPLFSTFITTIAFTACSVAFSILASTTACISAPIGAASCATPTSFAAYTNAGSVAPTDCATSLSSTSSVAAVLTFPKST